MCGITGFTWEDKDLLRKMTDIIAYRGPDDHGYYTDKDVSLGHRRLSIIDLSAAGHQPMTNEDGSIMIVFNGEIYNFQDIKPLLEKKHQFRSNSDTEVLIHGYEEWGPEGLLRRINGMFAIALWDSNKKLLFLARDRLGKKPLYYFINKNNLVFSSELKALLEYSGIKRELDINSVNSYLSYRFIPSDKTMIKGVKKLLPAHFAIFQNRKLAIKRYWSIDWSISDKPEDYYIKSFSRLFRDCVEKRLFSDVPLGAFLSGGIDSSAVVAMNSKLRPDPVKTFTVGFNHRTDELKYARIAAEHLHCDHHELILDYHDMTKSLPEIIWYMDEPSTDITMVPLYFLSKFAKKKVTVVNSGEGADELFSGYAHYKIGSNSFNLVPSPIKKSIYSWYYSPFKFRDRRVFFESKPQEDDSLKQYLTNDKPKHLLNKLLLFDIENELPNWQLARVDRMTMANAQEARVPFLDYRMVEFSASLPINLKMRNITGKYLLKKAVKDMLPDEIINRRKQGFTTPMHDWFREDLLGIAEQVLSKENMKDRKYINYEYIKKLLELEKHTKQQLPFKYTSFKLLVILMLEMWQKIYLDNNSKVLKLNDFY
jgi:asparagine synthase (glutamine-hydrolysing)